MTEHWERCVRLKEPLKTKPFLIVAGLAALGLLLGLYRELSGLGYVTGLNDGYSWGLFKNWNVTALTALGSGGYAVAVLAWIFNEKKFHPIMRTAVLTSLVGYGTGMMALGFDVGRPWNFVWLADPRTWNHYSVLWEVAVCMTAYFMLALDVENMPPFLERMYRSGDPAKKAKAMKIFNFMQKTFPVRHRAGVCAAFDAPVVAGIADVSGGSAGKCVVANADAAAAVFADGLHPGICVRAAGAGAERLFLGPRMGFGHSGAAGASDVVDFARMDRDPVR